MHVKIMEMRETKRSMYAKATFLLSTKRRPPVNMRSFLVRLKLECEIPFLPLLGAHVDWKLKHFFML
jgi:hypothetical protein